jgi:hypothetical protein
MEQPPEIYVKFFRLNTGEDIVCESHDINSTDVMVINPLKIVYSLNEMTGMLNVSLIQWVFPKISEKESFSMGINNIVISSMASLDMTSYYYKSLDKINAIQNEKNFKRVERDEYDDDEGDYEDDVSDEVPDFIKEKLEEVLKNKKKLH